MSEFRRQHPVAAISKVLDVIRQNFITLVILLFIGTSRTDGMFLYFLLGGLGLALIGGVFGWWVFKYRVHEDELQIQKGIFVKNKLYLSKDRIQVIDITQGILQRIFGLVKVEVKTAGGGTETATINAITRELAEELRAELRNKSTNEDEPLSEGESEAKEKEEQDQILGTWSLSKRDLVMAAFTSGNFGLIASILGAISGQLNEFINEETIEYVYAHAPGYSNFTVIATLILGILLISYILSFLGVIFRYTDFRLEFTSKEIIVTSGLFEKKHITVPYDRIQAVRFVEGILRQPFGYGMLYVESAGFNQTDKGRSIVLVPFMRASALSTFLNEFLPAYKEPEFEMSPPRKAIFRYMRRPNYSMLILIPIAWYLFEYGWIAVGLIPALTFLGWLRFKDAALALGEDVIRLRQRVLSRTTAIIRRKRVQSVNLSSNPFQRHKEIQTLQVTAASGSGGVSFEVMDLTRDDSLKALDWTLSPLKPSSGHSMEDS